MQPDPNGQPADRDPRAYLARLLEWLFLADILLTVGMVAAMHILRPPYLEPFRAPSDLRRTGPIWGLPWPQVMNVYHFALVTLTGNMLVNKFGLRRLSSFRWSWACRGSAIIGGVLAGAVLLYFALEFVADRPFSSLDHQSAAIYSAYASALLAANVLTLVVATPGFYWRLVRLRHRRVVEERSEGEQTDISEPEAAE